MSDDPTEWVTLEGKEAALRMGLQWGLPYEQHLRNPRAVGFNWAQIQAVFGLSDPAAMPFVGVLDGAGSAKCSRFLRTCHDLAQLTIWDDGFGFTVRVGDGGLSETVEANLPAREAVRGAALTFRQLFADDESASFLKVRKIIGQALHARAGEAVSSHSDWVAAHNKLLNTSLDHLARDYIHEHILGAKRTRSQDEPWGWPGRERPRDLILAYHYGDLIHADDKRAAALPTKQDEFEHAHGLVSYLRELAHIGSFYLGYGELVHAVTGIPLDGG